jgi:thioesterase domain-containing protein
LRRSPTTVEVPGNHSSMILRPHVSTLAAELRRALDDGTAGA